MRLRPPTKRQRGGFTLRELMIAITVGSTVMMTAVGLIHHAFDWSTQAKHRRQDDQTFFNLSRQLRQDLHQAGDARVHQPNSTEASLELSIVDHDTNTYAVTYTIDDQQINRIETRDDNTVRREDYRFKHRREITFTKLDSDNQVQLNIKAISPFASTEAPVWRTMRASIGLRVRHQNGDIES